MPPLPIQIRCAAFIFTTLVSLALAQPQAVLAQSGTTGPPPARIAKTPDPTDQEQVVSYWTTETGWRSELQLRNNLSGKILTVTPTLRAINGSETPLAPVTVMPQEVKSIDIETALGTTAPQLVGTYGSLVLRYRTPGHRSLYAALMIHNIGHPFAFHVDAVAEDPNLQTGSREGIWWLPKDTTSDYLILTNHGKEPLPVLLSLYDAGGKESKQNVLLGPHAAMRYSVRKLILAAGLSGSYGGIKVSAASHAGSLDTLHFLFDEQAAFSAILKMFDHDPNANLEERDFAKTSVWTMRAPMLALSNPDPALAFPLGTTLQPQLFIRNTTAKALDAALRFNWRTGNATGKAPGPVLRLNPFETRRIDIAALQNGGTLPKEANWTSVTLTTQGTPDEVMAVAASYDQALRYGAQTPFTDQLSFRWEGGMWEYDAYHSSIITAGNGGTKPTQAAFTIFYNQGTEKYELEQTLKPDEQMWMDVGKLIREHTPDKNGKTLPTDVTSGSFEFRDLTNTGIGTLFEGKIVYDKTYGHVTYGCSLCCGYQPPAFLAFDPLAIPFLGTSQNGVWAYDPCLDVNLDVTGYFYSNWSTLNTAIATVNPSGQHTGVSVGSTITDTWGDLASSTYRLCPIRVFPPQGGSNVMPVVTIGSLSQNPILKGSTATVTVTVNPSATVSLVIGGTGTGTATFDSQGGSTTKTISGTTPVTIYGSAASGGTGDLTLTASYNGTTLAYANFSVTSGACTLGSEHDSGGGMKTCPSTATLTSNYTVSQYCPTCSYTCLVHTDGTFTPTSGCSAVAVHVGVTLTGGETTSVSGTFSASDCNWHYAYFVTRVTNAQNVVTDYAGGNIGLKCISSPNGNACP
jgi:hypothetical protein